MNTNINQEFVGIENNDIFYELNEENKKLKNELMFANNCLNVFNKFKLLLSEIYFKYENNIDFEDKQKFSLLEEEFNAIITANEEMNNSLTDFHAISTDITEEDMNAINETVVKSEPIFDFDYLKNRQSTDVSPHIENNTEFKTTGSEETKKLTKPLKPKKCDQKVVNKNVMKDIELFHFGNTYLCQECHKVFNSEILLKQHMEIHYMTFVCLYEGCGERFQSMADRKVHNKSKHKFEKQFKCNECNEMFTNNIALIAHKVIHPGNGFECKECHKVFRYEYILNRHMKTHALRYVCTFKGCGKRFSSKTLKDIHIKTIHAFDKPYDCTECDQKFFRYYQLIRHKETHLGITFECNECQKIFKTQSLLNRHIRTHSSIVCTYEGCDQRFQYETRMRAHIRMKHTFGQTFKCSECEKTFVTKNKLKIHKNSHLGKKLKCDLCQKVFFGKALLNQHKTTHSFRILCPFDKCNQKFRLNSQLRAHIQSKHAIIQPLKCPECDQTFPNKSALNKHITTHPGKTYECEECHKVFTNERHFKGHQKNHSLNEQIFVCDFCEYESNCKFFVDSHVIRYH